MVRKTQKPRSFVLVIASLALVVLVFSSAAPLETKATFAPVVTSYTTAYQTVTVTVVQTYQTSIITMGPSSDIASGTMHLYPDPLTPFHAFAPFTVKPGGQYRLRITSDGPISLVKILTPSDAKKKEINPEDPTIRPLEIWSNVRSLDEPLKLDPGDYDLYMYSSRQTLTADYSISCMCPQTVVKTIESTTVVTQTSVAAAPGAGIEQFWPVLALVLIVLALVLLVRRRRTTP